MLIHRINDIQYHHYDHVNDNVCGLWFCCGIHYFLQTQTQHIHKYCFVVLWVEYFLPKNHICTMQNAKEPITNIPLWQKKEMMRKKWKKICLLAVFIYQPKLLFATDVLDRLKKCNRIYVNAFSLCMECCCILMYLDCILFLLRYICMIIIVVS